MFILDLYKAPLRSFRFIYYSIHRSTLSPPNAVRPRYFLSLWFLLTHRFIYIWKYKIKYMFGSWHFGNKTGLRTPQGPAFPQKGLFLTNLIFVARVAAPTIQFGAPSESQRSPASTRGATTVWLWWRRVARTVHRLRRSDRHGAVDRPSGLRIWVELGLSPRD